MPASGEHHPAFEEYCECIFELDEDDVAVIQARIAERLQVSRPAVSEMIRRLETEGLVVATPYTERPVRVQYDLTAAGRELAAALVALSGWGAAAEGRPGEHFHESCGTALELRPWCPTCDRVVGDDESRHTYEL